MRLPKLHLCAWARMCLCIVCVGVCVHVTFEAVSNKMTVL